MFGFGKKKQPTILVNLKEGIFELVRFKDRWEVFYPTGQHFKCLDNHKDGPGFILPIDINNKTWTIEVGIEEDSQ